MLPLSCWGPEKFRQGSFIDYPAFLLNFNLTISIYSGIISIIHKLMP